jgi:protocatechuate 3,4-dioxygenase beta subunit
MTRAAVVLFGAATLLWQPPRDTPPQPRSTGTIRGRVVAAATGDPIRNARVSVSDDHDRPPVLSDADGRFVFPALPPGRYSLSASKAGFAKQAFGARAPGDAGTPIRLAAGTVVDDVVVALPRGAAIAGMVIDETGEPASGVSVTIERVGDRGHATAMPIVGSTDGTGGYRISGLDAGSVLVSVFATPRSIVVLPDGGMMSGGGDLGQRIYYPDAARAEQAQPIALQPGDEKTGIDFVTPAAVPVARPVAPPPRDATVISGRVVSAQGRALPGAALTLEPGGSPDAPPRQTVSDADGTYQFVLPHDASGTFGVLALRDGYLAAWYGQREERDMPEEITVRAGGVRANLDVVLPRPAVISGRIFDENGDPVEGALLRAWVVRSVGGRQRLIDFAVAAHLTDDGGRFRISRLWAGEYILSASVGQATWPMTWHDQTALDLPGYAVTYFPGTPNPADAQPVAVGASGETGGVDFSIVRTRTARVAGQAFDAAGEPVGRGITLSPSHRSVGVAAVALAPQIERDGRFEFTNVPPGDYVLQVSRNSNGAWNEGDTASQFVTVAGADVTGLEVRASSGSTITGRIVVEGDAPSGVKPIQPRQIELSPLPLDPDQTVVNVGPPARALIGDDLRFEIGGLQGPRRLRLLRAPAGFALKAILSNGSDVSDAALPFGRPDQSLDGVEVVLTPHVTEIAGSVTDARAQPFNHAAIVAFAVDPSLRYSLSRFVGTAATDHEGRYRLEGLPPGEYYVAAADRRRNVDVEDPDFLESLTADAARVTLGEGQHVSLALRAR